MPSGGGNHRKKRLSAKERKKVLAAYKAVGPIIDRNARIQEEEASQAEYFLKEGLLKDYILEDEHHAQNKNHHDSRASDG